MTGTAERPRRKYESPLRRERAAQTRARIVEAGAAILHDHAVWNWDDLTIGAVAARAGVNARTVYRHFGTERELRDAVFAYLEDEAGVVLEGLELEDLPDFTERLLEYVSSFPLEPRSPRDPTLMTGHRRQRDALKRAVERATPGWSERDRLIAAAMLDVLWSVASYERLVADWELDPKDAVAGATWALELVSDAIRRERPPSG